MTEVREYDIEALGTEKKKNKGRLKKSLIVFGCVIAGIVVLALIGGAVKDAVWGSDKDISANGPYIAKIYVEGTIIAGQTDNLGLPTGYQHDWTLKKNRRADQ